MPLVKRALLGSVSCAWQHLATVTLSGFRKFTKKDIIPSFTWFTWRDMATKRSAVAFMLDWVALPRCGAKVATRLRRKQKRQFDHHRKP